MIFDSPGLEGSGVGAVLQTKDGGYVLTGSTGQAPSYVFQIWLVKLAPPPDTTPPAISVLSPENQASSASSLSLTFIVSEPTSWVGYNLDGAANVTIAGNTTLTGLANGSHNVTVYAKDLAGNTGASKTVYFSIEPFPTTWVAVAIVSAAVVGAGLVVYFRKRKRKAVL